MTKEINTLQEAIHTYLEYCHDLKVADEMFYSEKLSEGEWINYILRVEAYPFYSIKNDEFKMDEKNQNEFISWELKNRKFVSKRSM